MRWVMAEHTCKHCGEKYSIPVSEIPDDFCSFECWEAANCQQPVEAPTEEISFV
jgi:hypothetical protein